MKHTVLGGLAVGLLGFLGGWYPEYAKRSQIDAAFSASSKKLVETTQSLEVSRLRVRAALLWEHVERGDYGTAGEMASKLFTDLRVFTNELPPGDLRQGLEHSLGGRDAIVASLAKADPSAKGMIRDLFKTFPER